jgi:hypothetical protein
MNTCSRMECRIFKKALKGGCVYKKCNENWGLDMFDTTGEHN